MNVGLTPVSPRSLPKVLTNAFIVYIKANFDFTELDILLILSSFGINKDFNKSPKRSIIFFPKKFSSNGFKKLSISPKKSKTLLSIKFSLKGFK